MEQSKFTLRINEEMLKKFRYIADYNARSANRELAIFIKKHVAEFEKKYGKISIFLLSLCHHMAVKPFYCRQNDSIIIPVWRCSHDK